MPALSRPVVRLEGYEEVRLQPPAPLALRTRLHQDDNLNDSRDAFQAAVRQWAASLDSVQPGDVMLGRRFAHPDLRFMVVDLVVREAAHDNVTAAISAAGLLTLPPPALALWARPVEVTWARRPLPTKARVVHVPPQLDVGGLKQMLTRAGYALDACSQALDPVTGMQRVGAIDVLFSASNTLPLPAQLDLADDIHMRVDLLSRLPEAPLPPAPAASGSFAAAVAGGASGWLGWALPRPSSAVPQRPVRPAAAGPAPRRNGSDPKPTASGRGATARRRTRDPRPNAPLARPAVTREDVVIPPPPPLALATVPSAVAAHGAGEWQVILGAKRARLPAPSGVSGQVVTHNSFSTLTDADGTPPPPPLDDGATAMSS